MKRYIRSAIDANILYHGGRSAQPKVASQKELGIHVSPSTEEARVHFVTLITKCSVDVSDALDCEDMNDWASLEAFIAILEAAGVMNGREVATAEWRNNNCRTNTAQASAIMRDCLLDYGITCIHYVDMHEIEGADCYILLEDAPFKVVESLEECWPNLVEANRLLPQDQQIRMHTDCRPYYVGMDRFLHKVPKALFLAPPEDIVAFIEKDAQEFEVASQSTSVVADIIADRIRADFNCDVTDYKNTGATIVVLLHSDSIIDINNPRISISHSAKRVTTDVRYNKIVIPSNCDIDSVYANKVYPFIEQSL